MVLPFNRDQNQHSMLEHCGYNPYKPPIALTPDHFHPPLVTAWSPLRRLFNDPFAQGAKYFSRADLSLDHSLSNMSSPKNISRVLGNSPDNAMRLG